MNHFFQTNLNVEEMFIVTLSIVIKIVSKIVIVENLHHHYSIVCNSFSWSKFIDIHFHLHSYISINIFDNVMGRLYTFIMFSIFNYKSQGHECHAEETQI